MYRKLQKQVTNAQAENEESTAVPNSDSEHYSSVQFCENVKDLSHINVNLEDPPLETDTISDSEAELEDNNNAPDDDDPDVVFTQEELNNADDDLFKETTQESRNDIR